MPGSPSPGVLASIARGDRAPCVNLGPVDPAFTHASGGISLSAFVSILLGRPVSSTLLLLAILTTVNQIINKFVFKFNYFSNKVKIPLIKPILCRMLALAFSKTL